MSTRFEIIERQLTALKIKRIRCRGLKIGLFSAYKKAGLLARTIAATELSSKRESLPRSETSERFEKRNSYSADLRLVCRTCSCVRTISHTCLSDSYYYYYVFDIFSPLSNCV